MHLAIVKLPHEQPVPLDGAKGRCCLCLPVHARADPDYGVGLLQSGQSLVFPAAWFFIAMVGSRIHSTMDPADAVQPGARNIDGAALRCLRPSAGIRIPAL